MNRVVEILRKLYVLVDELERLHEGRRFTLDGHMVGSIGEVWAKWLYGVELLPTSTPCHDAKTADGLLVQVKATQGKSVSLYSEPHHLIVLKLLRDGTAEEVYNGPGSPAWEAAGKKGKNGQRPISIVKLRALMGNVPGDKRLARSPQPEEKEG